MRAPTLAPLSKMQELVCILLGVMQSYAAVGEHLSISEDMVRVHAKRAAAKIPGDMAAQAKCVAWARGATLDVLTGTALRSEVMAVAYARRSRSGDVGRIAATG